MSQIIDAIYEDGVLKPLELLNLREHTRVRIQVSPVLERSEGMEEYFRRQAEEILALVKASCEGLSEEELAIMESNLYRCDKSPRLFEESGLKPAAGASGLAKLNR